MSFRHFVCAVSEILFCPHDASRLLRISRVYRRLEAADVSSHDGYVSRAELHAFLSSSSLLPLYGAVLPAAFVKATLAQLDSPQRAPPPVGMLSYKEASCLVDLLYAIWADSATSSPARCSTHPFPQPHPQHQPDATTVAQMRTAPDARFGMVHDASAAGSVDALDDTAAIDQAEVVVSSHSANDS